MNFRKILLLLGLLVLADLSFSQAKFDVSGGFGLPEFAFLKVRYGGNFKIGLSHGYLKSYDVKSKTWDLSWYYNFGRKSKYSDDRTWYTMVGGDYEIRKFDEEAKNDEVYGFYLRIGRVFNFSEKLGMNLDIGPGALFFENNTAIGGLMESISLFIRL